MAKLKNWIIKKLGGYTRAEYESRPVDRFEFLSIKQNDIVTLQTEGEFDVFNEPPKEWLEDKLMGELAKKIKPYVMWDHARDCYRMKKFVRAAVKVVNCNV